MGNLTDSLFIWAMANLTQITGGFTPSVHVHTKKAYGLNIYQILIIFQFIWMIYSLWKRDTKSNLRTLAPVSSFFMSQGLLTLVYYDFISAKKMIYF
jgi:drug/metabolite transporter superfamily protein YnfA